MPPFPRHFEAPRFEKYRGKGNPIDHIREFCASCTKLINEPTYLMRLFPRSLGGPALEWYSKLLGNIKSWSELADKFISHFSFNITNEVTFSDLCSTKQKVGEPFITFLLCWRSLVSQCSLDIPEEQQVKLCIENLVPDLMYELKIKSPSTISKLMKKGASIEDALIRKGILGTNKDNTNTNSSNDKPKIFSKNKNVTNDGIVDAHIISTAQPQLTLKGANPTNSQTPNQTTPQQQKTETSTQEKRYPRTKDRKFTPLGIPLETALQQLLSNNFLQLLPIKDEPLTKAGWWDDKKYCDYHRTKGHKTSSCFQLKHAIQDLIDDGVIIVDPSLLASNSDHTIFKDPLGNHDEEKPSSSNSNSQGNVNYTCTGYDYTINCFNELNFRISTFRLKAEDRHCAVTTHRSKITLPGAPSRPNASTRPTPPSRPTAPTSSD